MNLTSQQIKDKLVFLEEGKSYKTLNRSGVEIKVEVTEEFTSSQKDTIKE